MVKVKKQPSSAKASAGQAKKVVKNKTKVVTKKTAVKLRSKKSVAKKRSVRAVGKEKKDLNTEIIFDSRVGKTDALFVDEPATAPVAELPVAPTETPEFKIPEILTDTILDPKPQEQENPPSPKGFGEAIKKWWQKLFRI